MAVLGVPESHKRALRQLADLPQVEFDRLVAGLTKLEPTLSRSLILGAITRTVESWDEDMAEALISALVSAQSAGERYNLALDELVASLAKTPGLDLRERAAPFSDRLKTLLRVADLARTSKAVDVMTEHERVYFDGRVLTDVRPVFGEKIEDGPDLAVVVHMLRIAYSDRDSRMQSMYFALDTSDVIKLRRALDRAVAKSEALHAMLSLTPVSLLDVEEDD